MIRVERLPDATDWTAVLGLVMRAFAYMDGVIDPPSSAHRLTPGSLRSKARREVALGAFDGAALVGCAFLDLSEGRSCLGKVAVEPSHQGKGVGRLLVEAAIGEARRAGRPWIELQTRVELTKNHAAFARLGFVETRRTAHAGFDRPTSITMRKALA